MSIAGLNTLPTERAMSLLISQYSNATNFKDYINIILEEFNELHANSLKVLNERSLEVATGHTLEVIGEIVGQARGSKLVVSSPFFGFENSLAGGTFGSYANANTGEVFRSEGSADEYLTVLWNDEEYRKFIKARIIKNTRAITVNTLIEIILTVVSGISDVIITLTSPLNYNIHIPEIVSDNDKLLLLTDELLPVPIGCRFTMSDLNGEINTN